MTDPIHSRGHSETPEVSAELLDLDEQVGRALKSLKSDVDPKFVDRVVAASRQDLPPRTLRISTTPYLAGGLPSPSWLRAAAAILVVTGVAVVAWFGLQGSPGSVGPKGAVVLVETMPAAFRYPTREEAMLVAVLDGDGAWLDQASLDHPATLDAEPVLRTQGTNVDDLANEIDLILGATS